MQIGISSNRIFGFAVFALALAAPKFVFTNDYNRGLLVLTVIYAIAGLSLDYIMGQMGQFSFGHAAFWGFGAYVSAKLALDFGLSPWLGFVAATVAAGIVGLGIGLIALRRNRGLELAIVTLGFGVLAWIVALRWRSVTGGPAGLRKVPSPSIFGWEIRSEFSYYYLALGFLLLIVWVLARLEHTRFGRAVRSINENEALASAVGVSARKYYVLAFGFSCALVGFSGALYAHHFRFVNPNLLSLQPMFIFLIIVLVGGSGTLWGPVLGAAAYVWISEYLRVIEEFRFLIFGVVLLLIVLFMPRGIYPTLREGVIGANRLLFGRWAHTSGESDSETVGSADGVSAG